MLTAIYPQEDSWHSVLLEAESTPGPAGRIRSIEKSNDLIRNQTYNLLACSVVPQPATLLYAPGIMGRLVKQYYLEEHNLLGCNGVYFNRSSLMFWRNISPPASVSEDGSDIFL
jgi:hypothetical protein